MKMLENDRVRNVKQSTDNTRLLTQWDVWETNISFGKNSQMTVLSFYGDRPLPQPIAVGKGSGHGAMNHMEWLRPNKARQKSEAEKKNKKNNNNYYYHMRQTTIFFLISLPTYCFLLTFISKHYYEND